MSGEDLRTGLQRVPGDGEGAAGDGEVDGDRVAPALEADGRRVDGHVAALADDLAVGLVVAGGPARLAGVQAHPVGAAVLEDDDEAHLGSAGGVVGEAVEVTVLSKAVLFNSRIKSR